MKYTDIKINPKNPRTINPDKLEKLKKSVEEFIKMLKLRPIVVNKDGMILGGNMRFKALKELEIEWQDEFVRVADELTPEEEERFIITDNIMFGDWDWEMIESDWDKEQLIEWGMDIIDYNEVNDEENFNEFNQIQNEDEFYHLNIAFDTEEEMKDFMEKNGIELDNNYKRMGKVISIHYPPEQRQDIKNVKFE